MGRRWRAVSIDVGPALAGWAGGSPGLLTRRPQAGDLESWRDGPARLGPGGASPEARFFGTGRPVLGRSDDTSPVKGASEKASRERKRPEFHCGVRGATP